MRQVIENKNKQSNNWHLTDEQIAEARRLKKNNLERREGRIAFGIVSIKLVGFAMFTIIPIVCCVIYSFMKDMSPWRYPNNILSYLFQEKYFAGFENYTKLFTNAITKEKFLNCLVNTVILLISVPGGMFLGMLLALILTKKTIKMKTLWRVLIYIPVVASAVAMGYIWQYIFNGDYGLIQKIFHFDVNWFSSDHKWLTRIAIIIKSSWGSMGKSMILYLGAMLGISKSYYEAAEIDGASSLKKFTKITFPLISPTTFYLLVMGVIGHLQAYADSLIFAKDCQGSITVVWFIYNYGIDKKDYGVGSAVAVMLALIIMGLTVIQFKRSKKWVFQG